MQLEEIQKAAAEGTRFAVDQYRGIAFYYLREETKPDEDTVWTGQENPTGRVLMVMVGDDGIHSIDPDEVTALDDDAYCSECGQIGCTADGR